jgi:hypothetical protein
LALSCEPRVESSCLACCVIAACQLLRRVGRG